jgi:hypothetical protein
MDTITPLDLGYHAFQTSQKRRFVAMLKSIPVSQSNFTAFAGVVK